MMTQTYQFKTPSVIVNGPGAAREAGSFAKGLGKKALIVTDHALEKIGLLNDVKNSLEIAEFLWQFMTRLLACHPWIIRRKG